MQTVRSDKRSGRQKGLVACGDWPANVSTGVGSPTRQDREWRERLIAEKKKKAFGACLSRLVSASSPAASTLAKRFRLPTTSRCPLGRPELFKGNNGLNQTDMVSSARTLQAIAVVGVGRERVYAIFNDHQSYLDWHCPSRILETL